MNIKIIQCEIAKIEQLDITTEVHLWKLWWKSRKLLLVKSLRDFLGYMCVRISIVNWEF